MSDKENYLKSYIGRKCTVYMSIYWYGVASGTIEKCENGWIMMEIKGKTELINIDRINRISIMK
jgi:hypothetical protein